MRWFDRLTGRRRAEFDLDEEIRVHLELEVQDRMRDGLTRRQAELAARREFGNVTEVKEVTRAMWGWTWLERIAQDLRYGIRGLRRSPGFTLIAVLSLALGISVNLTIYSLGRNVLLEQPSAYQPERLCRPLPNNGPTSYPNYRDFAESKVFADLAAYGFRGINWQDAQQTYQLFSATVTANFFEVMGIKAARGRTFLRAEARAELSPALAVVSHRFWLRRLGGRQDVLGQKIILDGHAFEIIGVLDQSHRSTGSFGISPEIYVPISPLVAADLQARAKGPYLMIGRLPEGISRETAQVAFREAARRLEQTHPKENRRLAEIHGVFALSGWDLLKSEPGVRPLFLFFAVLIAIVGLVLLIACANVAGLLLARAAARQREIAIRLAIGAGRWRLVHQLLVESAMLAFMATGAGLVLHETLSELIQKIPIPIPAPLEFHISTDPELTLYAVAMGVLTVLLCGLAPALQATRPSLVPALKGEHGQGAMKRFTLRNAMVAGQLALSMVLLVTAFLFVRNLYHLTTISPGFDVSNIAAVETRLVAGRQADNNKDQHVKRFITAMESVPGVERVAYAGYLPLNFVDSRGTRVKYEGTAEDAAFSVQSHPVGPGYFRTMGMRIVQGREFDQRDAEGTVEVAIINQTLAARRFPGGNALGKRLIDGVKTLEIIGISADSKYSTLGEAPKEILYRPQARRNATWFVVRVAGPLRSTVPLIRRAVQQADPTAAVEARSMDSYLTVAFFPSRAGAIMLGALGFLGLLLALVGLYAIMAYAVTRRVPEIGIRMALGATRGQVLREVLNDGALMLGIGTAIGLGLALMATRPLAVLLAEGFSPNDPITFVTVPLALIAIGLIACLGPARKAIRTDPIRALRYD